MPFSFGMDLGGILGGIAQAQANAQATQLGYAQLQFAKEQAKKEYDLATSARSDAYGNTVSYDDILHKWITKLSGSQEQLLKLGEHEQTQSLTDDAPRQRLARQRAGERAYAAETDYNTAQSGYRYDQPPSEKAIFGELATLLSGAQQQREKTVKNGLGIQAQRMGNGASIPSIIKASNDYAGAQLPDTLLQARNAAFSESQSRDKAHDSKYLPELEHFAQVEDAVGNGPLYFSNKNDETQNTQGAMLNAIASALSSGGAGVQNAYSNLASLTSRAPSFGSMNLGFSGGAAQPQQPNYLRVGPQDTIIDPSNGGVIYSGYKVGSMGGMSGGMGSDDPIDTAIAALNNRTSNGTF
jgi:hypothetical protein